MLLAHGPSPTSPQHVQLALTSPPDGPVTAGLLAEKSAQPWEAADSAEIPLISAASRVLHGAAVTWQSEKIEMYLLGDILTPGATEGC